MAFAQPFHRRKKLRRHEQKLKAKTYFWHSFWKESRRNYIFAIVVEKHPLKIKQENQRLLLRRASSDKN